MDMNPKAGSVVGACLTEYNLSQANTVYVKYSYGSETECFKPAMQQQNFVYVKMT